MGIKYYEEKIPTQLESNPRSSHQEADVGPLHYRVAVGLEVYIPSAATRREGIRHRKRAKSMMKLPFVLSLEKVGDIFLQISCGGTYVTLGVTFCSRKLLPMRWIDGKVG